MSHLDPVISDPPTDDERHVYLLTNVATRLPVDRVVGFDAFLNPTEHHLDVRDSAHSCSAMGTSVPQRRENTALLGAPRGFR